MAKARPIPTPDPDASLFVQAALAIGTRLEELLEYEAILPDPNEVYELHQMRIAAKRLRYTLEIFQPAYNDYSRLGKDFAAIGTEIKKLQEHLGEIHDADVLAPQLTGHLRSLLEAGSGKDKHGAPIVGVHNVDYDACLGVLTLCRELCSRRDERYRQLLQDWAQWQEAHLFDRLRRLLRTAVTEDTLAEVLHDRAAESLPPAPQAPEGDSLPSKEETTDVKISRTDPRPIRPPAGRKRQSTRS